MRRAGIIGAFIAYSIGLVAWGYHSGYWTAAEDFQGGSAPTADREDYGQI